MAVCGALAPTNKQMSKRFPIVNRAVVVLVCVVILVSIAWTFASAKARAELDIVAGLLAVVFGGMACWGLWLTLTWRERPSAELDELDSVNFPPPSDDGIAYRYVTGTKSGAVLVDPQRETICFVNCHVPRRMLAVAEKQYTCPIDDIRAVHRFSDRWGESLTIITEAGKAIVLNKGEGFEDLWRLLKDLVPENAPGFATDDPRMGFVWVLGAIGGLFGGWYLTPERSGDTTLGLFLLCGAIFGVVGGHLLIKIIDRWFRVNVVKAIGYGTLGAIAGLGIGSSFMLTGRWPAQTVLWATLVGFILGAGLSRAGGLRER